MFVRSFCLWVLIRGLQNLESPFWKVLIWLVRSRHCGELNRGSQNLEAPFGKGLNFVSGKLLFGWADSRFGKLRISLRGSTILFFSLVRKEPKVPEGLRPSRLPGTIQSSAGNIFGEASGGTSRTRLFAQNGGEKALNRCEVRALQRKELERTAKE